MFQEGKPSKNLREFPTKTSTKQKLKKKKIQKEGKLFYMEEKMKNGNMDKPKYIENVQTIISL